MTKQELTKQELIEEKEYLSGELATANAEAQFNVDVLADAFGVIQGIDDISIESHEDYEFAMQVLSDFEHQMIDLRIAWNEAVQAVESAEIFREELEKINSRIPTAQELASQATNKQEN